MFEVLNIDRQRANKSVTMQSTRIITHFYDAETPLFILTGFSQLETLLKLKINFVLLRNMEVLNRLTKRSYQGLKVSFESYQAFYILRNTPHAIDELRAYHTALSKIFTQIFLIDLEVLKAHELLITGLSLEDTVIGLEMPRNATLTQYIKEVRKEHRNGGTELYSYVRKHLIKEASRLQVLPKTKREAIAS